MEVVTDLWAQFIKIARFVEHFFANTNPQVVIAYLAIKFCWIVRMRVCFRYVEVEVAVMQQRAEKG